MINDNYYFLSTAIKITCPVKGTGSNIEPCQRTSIFPKIRATDTGLPPATSPYPAKAIRQAVWPKLKVKARNGIPIDSQLFSCYFSIYRNLFAK
ncbi:hypothetical protein BuS5_00430 [Desulfosarcina sp. BuS5]|nr:hypothetical protein BuS5_00430 [Desulfosarcina sp. BuS5]